MGRQKINRVDPLIVRIEDFYERVDALAQKAGLRRNVSSVRNIDISSSMRDGHAELKRVYINTELHLNPGLDYRLTAMVYNSSRDEDIGSAPRRQKFAELFVAHMQFLQARAEQTAERRKAIARVTNKVAAEAASKGIELELLKIETAPVLVHCEPGPRYDPSQVFYVHIVMPHDDEGVLTKGAYTVDAADPQEFGEYLRHYTMPELIALKSRFTPLAA